MRSPNPIEFHLLAAFLVVAVIATPAPAGYAMEPAGEGTSHLRIEALDGKGRPFTELSVGDLKLLEDGSERPITQLGVNQEPWRIVIWVDQELSPSRAIREATETLTERAQELVCSAPSRSRLPTRRSSRRCRPPVTP